MSLPIDLILYIVIAAGLAIWLKNTLGTRHGGERERQNPFDPANRPPEKQTEAPVRPMPHLDIPDKAMPAPAAVLMPKNTQLSSEVDEAKVAEIQQLDHGFTVAGFARNAQDAYAIVLESYAEGDAEALADLTTPSILAQFTSMIADRTARKVSLQIEVQAIRSCTITRIKRTGTIADIDLEFVADALMQEYADQALSSGHTDKTTELRDKWTFTRDLGQRDPAWRVSAIHDAVGE
ncbi:MAG: Tim44/TimA family putative adaptor protein [Pseudomonadota bacterium]